MRKQKRKIKVLDLFAGAGGFGLGFRLANPQYQLICSLEVDKWAAETLQANNVEKQKIILGDIRFFDTAEKIITACKQKPDIIIGGPPCQGFSTAGPVKDPKDPRNSLFKNFAQWVGVLQPSLFVMENVAGILNRKNGSGRKVIEIIRETFREIGYETTVWKLNAANYGVPQNRVRVFIVGNKFGQQIDEPPITHYLSSQKKQLNGAVKKLEKAIKVKDAICDLPALQPGMGEEIAKYGKKQTNAYQKSSRNGGEVLYNHVPMVHTKRVISRYKHIIEGNLLSDIEEEYQVRKRNGNGEISETEYNMNYRHLRPNMIAYTIPASFYSNFIHPYQPRNITSREAARLQSFPDTYIFKGKRTQISSKLLKQLGKEDENYLSQYNQIGNAVPPLLAKAVANRLFDFINEVKQKK